MNTEPEFTKDDVNAIFSIIKAIVLGAVAAYGAGWISSTVGKGPVIVVCIIIAIYYGVLLLGTFIRYERRERYIPEKSEGSKDNIAEVIVNSRKERDRAVKEGYILFISVVIILGLI